MEKKTIAGRTAEQWQEYACNAIEARRKAISDAQEMMCKERACLSKES